MNKPPRTVAAICRELSRAPGDSPLNAGTAGVVGEIPVPARRDVALIQTRINIARKVRAARQLARFDMPAPWLPTVLAALTQLGQMGVGPDRATVEYGRLRIIMPTRDPRARDIEAGAARACALMCAQCGDSADAYSGYLPACFTHATDEGLAFASLYVAGAFPSRLEAWAWWRTPHPELAGRAPCHVAVEEGGGDRVRQLLPIHRASDLRFLTLVRLRQVGTERVARALLSDAAALYSLQVSCEAEPSEALREVLDLVTTMRRG